MDSIHLHGAETVGNAAHTMRSAAETMSQAATNIDGALERHQRFMDDWLQRFEFALEKARNSGAPLDGGDIAG